MNFDFSIFDKKLLGFTQMLTANRSIRKLKLHKLEIFDDRLAHVVAETFSKMENLSELTF